MNASYSIRQSRLIVKLGKEVRVDANKMERQLIIGCIPLGIFIISGSI